LFAILISLTIITAIEMRAKYRRTAVGSAKIGQADAAYP